MSLINQMLQDLDARHEGDARAKLRREVRALPSVEQNRGLRRAIAGLLAITLAAALWWSYERFVASDASRGGGAAMPTVVTAPPVLAPAEAVAAASTPAPPAADAVPAAVDVTAGLKLSQNLDRLPEAPIPPASVAPKVPRETRSAEVSSPKRSESRMAVEKTPVAKTDRDQADADYRRSVSLVNGGRGGEAVDILLGLLRLDGGHVPGRQLLARALVEQKRFDEAMAILAEGLASQPGQVSWAMMLARLQMERGNAAGAARTLQVSDPYATANADYQGFYGHVLFRQGRLTESVERYRAALRTASGEGRWWLGLGLALEAQGLATEARDAFLRARASGSLNPDLVQIVDHKLR